MNVKLYTIKNLRNPNHPGIERDRLLDVKALLQDLADRRGTTQWDTLRVHHIEGEIQSAWAVMRG